MDVNIRGDAETISANTPRLNIEEGDVLLIGKNHAALVIGFEGEQILEAEGAIGPEYIWITDSNYVGSCKPSTRKIAWDDDHIRGVYRPI